MIKLKKCLAIFMAGALIMTAGILPQESKANAAGDYGISNPRVENGVTTWDKIKFGSYYQDAEFEPEPIKWRVLSVDGDDAFLLADKCLDYKPYNKGPEAVTWETCTLRKWLNEDFYNEAFNSEEKTAISETTVINDDNLFDGVSGKNDTRDNVYLLSINEVCNVEYGFDSEFSNESKTRYTKNTDYAKINGTYTTPGVSGYSGNYWWLRSLGNGSSLAPDVTPDGKGTNNSVIYGSFAVRPVLHIDLSSYKVKDAGEVDSEGNVTEQMDGIHAPRVKDGVTIWDCVYFGNYKQNAKWGKKKDIEWRVLSVNEDDAFLIADRNLDCKPYNEEQTAVTWETCTLRKWLNEDFYNEAFNAEEKAAITETTVINTDTVYNDGEYEWVTDGGNDTTDKVYLLSIDEVSNVTYGFDSEFRKDSVSWKGLETKYAKNTYYAEANGGYTETTSGYTGNGYWWLRSSGYSNHKASYVCYDGYGSSYGDVVYGIFTVRPVLHINLSSSVWSRSGVVSSNGNSGDVSTPSEEPTKEPSKEPQKTPTETPTIMPTSIPSAEPTEEPNQGNKPAVPTQVPIPPQESIGNNTTGGNINNVSDNDKMSSAITQSQMSAKIISVKNKKKGCIIIKWNKTADISGCQIQYSTNRKFKKAKKVTVSKTKYIIKELKKKKLYYIRLRIYKIVNSNKIYSSWSKVKKIRIKK